LLIEDAELDGQAGFAVRIERDRIVAVGRGLERGPGEVAWSARGGAVLPGLHDHHIHLAATAAATRSLACGPPAVRSEGQLVAALRAASQEWASSESPDRAGCSWIRGVGYHESVAGELDARRLSQWVADRPLRIQHRSGACWMLNERALRALPGDPHDWPEGTERRPDGEPTGRFFRLDDWLRRQRTRAAADARAVSDGGPVADADDEARPSLAALSRALASRGVTGFTDTSADHEDGAAAWLIEASDRGELLQRGVLRGSEALSAFSHPRLERGALKIVLDEPALPDFDALVDRMAAAHAAGRSVAVHCVTRVELTFALAAWREAGAQPGDRIEHASVAPPDLVDWLARTPISVVTQPHFIEARGDDYLRDVDPDDRPWLYRARGFLDAGVPLAAGSDAPHGAPDPWHAMRAALERRTEAGEILACEERLDAEQAFALFTSEARQPGVSSRKIEVGAAADVIVLERPWREARRLESDAVVLTLVAGRVVFDRAQSSPTRSPTSIEPA
jgi:predicted amidohydrolase YtcJ